MKKLLSVVGARPQFIKIAPLFINKSNNFNHKVVHTGQHYDFNMSEIFFKELGLPEPAYHLGVGSGTNNYQVAEIIRKIEKVFEIEKPDIVVVYGDTNSTISAAIAASKMNLTLAHVEAGLRSYNKKMQEEINRVVTDHLSDILLCPTKNSIRNLRKEGINQDVFWVGDLMIEMIKIFESKYEKLIHIDQGLGKYLNKEYVLMTLHRAENVDDISILRRIIETIERTFCIDVIFPVHPRTRKNLDKMGINFNVVKVMEPISYFTMLIMEKHAKVIVTDSGGVQKEAFYFGVPCITLRTETEWIETIECKANILVSPFDYDFEEKLSKAFENSYTSGIGISGGLVKKYFGYLDVSRRIYEVLEGFSF
ncbi:MAG: UDP-N-acetylglucosamine 2-epimerase (non-hydrolyzing) [bacterium]